MRQNSAETRPKSCSCATVISSLFSSFVKTIRGWPQETLAVIFDRLGTTTAVLKYLMMWPLVQYVLGNCAAFSVDVWKHQLGRFGKLFAHPSLVWFLDRIWYEWSISALLDQLLYIFVSINWLTCRKSTKIRKIVHSIGPERKSFRFLALFILSILSRNSS